MIEEKINETLSVGIASGGETFPTSIVLHEHDHAGSEETRIVMESDEVAGLQSILAKHFPVEADYFASGKETGKRFAKAFFDTPLPAICLATLGMVTADLTADQRDRDRYVDGFVVGFYEVNPAKPTGISI